MAGFGNFVQKTVYFGVGLASYVTEKAGETLSELRDQAQKAADELVARGEITADEARKLVDEMVKQAQQQPVQPAEKEKPQEPRRIEILSDDEEPTPSETDNIDAMRRQVQAMQEELRRLKRD
ncbi:MAG TPA: hypothetical protein DDZ80_04140 [Cyanobacteria bacterium UBA8803]|nr:hypothetical protein [Cyanobacteria bacterium UBA9273]HBL57751.1 hypothetical protein [Cyanobacteria bacterium UBA8803]